MNRRKHSNKAAPPIWRNSLLLALFACAALVIQGRLVWLQLLNGDFYTEKGEQRQVTDVEMPAHRGLITDRNGEPVAVSTPVSSVIVNPRVIGEDRDGIYALAEVLERDGAELERDITSKRDRAFLYAKRHLAPTIATRALDLGIDGVSREVEYRRFYPAAEVTCQLLGLTDIDDNGIDGLEKVYDRWLAGESGSKMVRRDLSGRIIADIEEVQAARPGRDLRLSIDLPLQYLAHRELKRAVEEHDAESGSIVILDVNSGEVLAMVNQKPCNPNDRSQRGDWESLRNRAVTDPIEPGSVIKPLVLSASLANGLRPDDIIDVPAVLEVNGIELTYDENPLGPVTVTEILARSSSVGMGLIAGRLEPQDMWETLRSFGFAGPTDSGIGSWESHGSLSHYQAWSDQAQATMSYGYNLSVTPLQLARAYAAIGSGGYLPPVSFEALDQLPERRRVISESVAADLMAMLETVVSDEGTAWRAQVPNYRVAGKTGTAEIVVGGGYSKDHYRAIFAGIAPASDPKFVAVVVINDPRGHAYHGGEVAAPVFSSVMSIALRQYGIAPDGVAEERTLLSWAEEQQ